MLTKYKEIFLESGDGFRYKINQDGDEMLHLEYQEWSKEEGKFFKHSSISFPSMFLEQIVSALQEVETHE